MRMKVIRGLAAILSPALVWLAVTWILLATCATARADIVVGQSSAQFLKPVVTQRHFTDLIRPLELTREQRIIVELVYEDYRDAVEVAKREADLRADAKGRRIVADALAGRRMVPPADLRHYRVEVLKVYRELPAKAHKLAERLIADVRSVITSDQRPKLDEQMKAFRRMLHLHPRHLGRGDFEYAGEGVDILLLIDEARRDGGELARMPEDAVEAILREYEAELDVLLRASSVAYHESTVDARIARIALDERALRAAERRSLEQWQALYELNQRTVERIAERVATHVGDEKAHQWRRRFERETFAWMFTPTQPDRIYEWMTRQPLDDERLAEAKLIHDVYQQERWPLLREAVDIMIRARSEFETIVYSMMDPSDLRGTPRSLYRELLLNSGHLAGVESRTIAELESLLDDDQRRRMRREVRGR